MATLDIVLLAIMLLSAAIGFMRGLVKEVLSLATWVVAVFVAMLFAEPAAEWLPPSWGGVSLRMVIAFVLLFIVALIAGSLLQWLLAQLVASTGLSGTDRFLGFLFGGARGILIAIVILIGLVEVAGETTWFQDALIPPELLAFEDEVRELVDALRTWVGERWSTTDAPSLLSTT